jgi:hypothetical protein
MCGEPAGVQVRPAKRLVRCNHSSAACECRLALNKGTKRGGLPSTRPAAANSNVHAVAGMPSTKRLNANTQRRPLSSTSPSQSPRSAAEHIVISFRADRGSTATKRLSSGGIARDKDPTTYRSSPFGATGASLPTVRPKRPRADCNWPSAAVETAAFARPNSGMLL